MLREARPLSISKQINQIWPALSGKKYPKKLPFTRDVSERGASWWCAYTRRSLFVRLVKLLETIAGRSRTTNTWTYNLVKTVIIIMNFSHEGREGNWVLHLLDSGAMPPYFHSAGCHNYASYAAFYVHHMIGLDPVMMKKLQYRAFVRHIPGIHN